MQPDEQAQRLRIYIGESDRWQGRPLYECIVERARALGLAGATVLRGPMGFGASSRIHTMKLLRLSEDLPLIIEIVDSQPRLDLLIPELDGMVLKGLVTIEPVRVLIYRHNTGAKP